MEAQISELGRKEFRESEGEGSEKQKIGPNAPADRSDYLAVWTGWVYDFVIPLTK